MKQLLQKLKLLGEDIRMTFYQILHVSSHKSPLGMKDGQCPGTPTLRSKFNFLLEECGW